MMTEIGLTAHTRAILANPPKPFDYVEDPEDMYLSCSGLIKKYMPDFCWVTFQDLMRMLEEVNPDIDEACLKVTLSKMKAKGKVIWKKWPSSTRGANRGPNPLLYMRVS